MTDAFIDRLRSGDDELPITKDDQMTTLQKKNEELRSVIDQQTLKIVAHDYEMRRLREDRYESESVPCTFDDEEIMALKRCDSSQWKHFMGQEGAAGTQLLAKDHTFVHTKLTFDHDDMWTFTSCIFSKTLTLSFEIWEGDNVDMTDVLLLPLSSVNFAFCDFTHLDVLEIQLSDIDNEDQFPHNGWDDAEKLTRALKRALMAKLSYGAGNKTEGLIDKIEVIFTGGE